MLVKGAIHKKTSVETPQQMMLLRYVETPQPSPSHLEAAHKVLKYIKGTVGRSLIYSST